MQLHSRIPLAALLLSIVAALESEVRTLPDGTVTQVAEIRGVPKWHLFPHLWSHNNVDISCPNKQVQLWCQPVLKVALLTYSSCRNLTSMLHKVMSLCTRRSVLETQLGVGLNV